MKSKMIKSDPKRKEDSVFDRVKERAGSGSIKWDLREPMAGAPDLIPLWVADMDFPSPPEVVAALQRRVRHGIFGYSLRPDSYDDAVIGWMKKRFQWEIRKEWIAFAPGVVPALNFALQAFTQAGDAVIVQPPVYTPFMQVVEINGRRLDRPGYREKIK